MKFKIEKNIFDNVITSMQPFLEKKDASNITSHIFLQVIDNILIIKSTDLEMGLKIDINSIEDSIDGKATINGSNLLGILKRLKNDSLIIEVLDNNLIIKQNRSKFKLPMYDANEYPSFPNTIMDNKLNINSIHLINSIKKITPAIDNNNPKFELNGALIDIKSSKINFVSTDTRRLAVSYLENISNKDAKIIIPKKAIIEIQKIFFDEIEISYDETYLIINTKNKQFFTKLINGKYPDYERIIPNSLKHNIEVSKDTLIESIKLVTSLSPNLRLTFSSNSIIFESIDDETESKTKIDIELPLEQSFTIAANNKYLLDFLSMANNEKIKIGFNESNLPFYLEDNKFFTIVMPIILEK
ncbi:MAG: DNA polymerase III subunit beta [Campylobacteraceae bacterium]|jgi:DNA polymerase-3 subunit beta|nr:DNA polymerase III subunit beta [Campylobacteraceae bacterium]MBT3882697.1 DNA polymerase III subunit beta [Campylobacteraceae bacterium]MBT4030423.1 DNA polymerase III subunit beta [Campylobacteraceae bacterium]MBT4178988.1 DNA polymerase III subunit beta [Campylobacteraceae bacterium]MBT4573013.1 DNA polymerase III subunit beta [Campylobacteraceae bacterium]